jgi:hypothetical protein
MGLGIPIGFSAKVAQSNLHGYRFQGRHERGIHVALMGDPALRAFVVAPPSEFYAKQEKDNNSLIKLTWNPSPDEVRMNGSFLRIAIY